MMMFKEGSHSMVLSNPSIECKIIRKNNTPAKADFERTKKSIT